MSTLQTARVYCLLDGAGQQRYVGSTVQPLEHRLAQHQWACRDDPTASPLYRSVASLDDWTIVALVELQFDAAVFPHALQQAEQAAIDQLREQGAELLNHNRPVDTNAARREYMREWRRRNAGYMAAKGREHRERRRQRLLQRTAEAGTVCLDAFAAA